MLKIGITGHRNLVDESSVRADIRQSFHYFKERDQDIVAVSSLAAGADMIFAEEAILQNIRLEVILPFALEEYKKDFAQQDIQRLELMISNAIRCEINQPARDSVGLDRAAAYLACGQRLVDECDAVLAVWNGREGQGTGGTSDIVEYCKQQKKELHILINDRSDEKEESDPVRRVTNLFHQYDQLAIHFKKKKFEPAWRIGLIAGLIAVASFSVGKALDLNHDIGFLLALLEFLSIAVSFISLAIFAVKFRRKFLENRRTAEYLRAISWYEKAGVPLPASSTLQHMPPAEILNLERTLAAEMTSIRNIDNARRIAWCLVEDQIRYHDGTRIARFRRRLHRLELVMNGLKYFFFIVTPLNFLMEALIYFKTVEASEVDGLMRFFLLMALSIPPFYAALEGVKYFSEWKRDIGISEQMIHELRGAKARILQAADEASLLQETKRLRDVLEVENNDWTVRFYEKEVGAKV